MRYGQTLNCWPLLESAADPSRVEIITETLGLRRAEGTKTCDFAHQLQILSQLFFWRGVKYVSITFVLTKRPLFQIRF